jgi:hypothetical protein
MRPPDLWGIARYPSDDIDDIMFLIHLQKRQGKGQAVRPGHERYSVSRQ